MYLMYESEVTMFNRIKKIFKYLFHTCGDDYHEEDMGFGCPETSATSAGIASFTSPIGRRGISSNTGKRIMPSAPVQVYVVDHDVIMTTKSGSVYCLLNQSFNTQLIENISDAIENEGYECI